MSTTTAYSVIRRRTESCPGARPPRHLMNKIGKEINQLTSTPRYYDERTRRRSNKSTVFNFTLPTIPENGYFRSIATQLANHVSDTITGRTGCEETISGGLLRRLSFILFPSSPLPANNSIESEV